MKSLFVKLGVVVSYLFSLRVRDMITSLYVCFYTGFQKRFFKSFGERSYIVPKLRMLVGSKCIEIGKDCVIGKNAKLTAYMSYRNKMYTPSLIIGDNVQIGDNVHITCINQIRIGNGVLMGSSVLITDNNHGSACYSDLIVRPVDRNLVSRGEVIIEDDVWIGEKASIMSGVKIGHGAIIGANVIVTKDVPAFTIVVGQPTRYLLPKDT